ncbi:unnamed protein product [Schistocephalus solidus]|uniref:Uncharacterized protein n=1 Tax=Schistocephalus solidus TaxID=70667 RepID=A0A183SZH4_SCHSO|nr:unnamed protein product [Schistocephalus solidus]
MGSYGRVGVCLDEVTTTSSYSRSHRQKKEKQPAILTHYGAATSFANNVKEEEDDNGDKEGSASEALAAKFPDRYSNANSQRMSDELASTEDETAGGGLQCRLQRPGAVDWA